MGIFASLLEVIWDTCRFTSWDIGISPIEASLVDGFEC